jgi:predicted transcriptional regulator
MLKKQAILAAIEALPEDAGIEEALARLELLYRVEKGIAEADAGRVVSHEEVLRLLSRWRG